MNYKIRNNKVIIYKGKKATEIPLGNLNSLIDDPIIQDLSFSELVDLWNILYGVPLNYRKYLEKKIELHDKSTEVNSFIFKDNRYWFDKNTRASLLALASCSENTITLVLGDELIELEVSKAKKFLSDLELYASKCFVNTAQHLKAIKQLKTLEDVINYDYTVEYPNKVNLDEYLDLA